MRQRFAIHTYDSHILDEIVTWEDRVPETFRDGTSWITWGERPEGDEKLHVVFYVDNAAFARKWAEILNHNELPAAITDQEDWAETVDPYLTNGLYGWAEWMRDHGPERPAGHLDHLFYV